MIFLMLILCVASGVRSKTVQIENVQSLILVTINEPASSFEACNKDLLEKATFADMIEIKRGGYFHWCVFVRDETVIHLHNPEFGKLSVENAYHNFTGNVELRNLIQLAGDDLCRINNKVSESKRRKLPALPESDTLALMKEELNRKVTYYNVVNYNCEHFAAKLKFGVPFSSQIDALKKISSEENLTENLVEMFEVAATLDFVHNTSSENSPEILSAVG
ncbi:Phospholipase A and acyltransferase 5 [Pseudolycoriella hygida]|uniref:Phospholipase A and acyltransferase 5 n=1 Tax=Pseudolycoriella hygida TaxID=35572 RepID=A0A9Q0S0L3_9DIPT|nr:Phospholipase A and acyltransferase 5 [Pseudolycoriella hygida]